MAKHQMVSWTRSQNAIERGRQVLVKAGLLSPREEDAPPTREELREIYEARLDAVDDLTATRRKLAVKREERREAVEAVEAEYAEELGKLAGKESALSSADHRARKVEAALRQTCPEAIREDGPVLHWLRSFREHVGGHTTRAIPWIRNSIRDKKRHGPDDRSDMGDSLHRLIEVQSKHDGAMAHLTKISAAEDRIRSLQLESEPDVTAAVAEIRDELGERCPVCGDRLPLAGLRGFYR